MKTFLLSLLVFLIIATPGIGQDYYHGEYSSFAGPSPNLVEVCGDTLIDEKIYQFIYFTTFNGDMVSYTNTQPYVIRKEEKKVYYRSTYSGTTQEILLYDYDLEVGESLSYYSDVQQTEVVAYTIDSIGTMMVNGVSKKQFFIKDHSFGFTSLEEGYILEDIGLIWGGQHPFYFFGAGPDHTFLFSCLYENQDFIFANPEEYNFLECDFENQGTVCFRSANKDLSLSSFDVLAFPNPVDNILTLDLNGSDYLVKLSNIKGQELLVGQNIQVIDFSNFDAGIYFITVQETKTGMLTTKRVVKSR